MSEQQPQLCVPAEAVWGPTFDVGRATDAYIATIPAADRAKSDAYYEGGYWIELWGTLITVALCLLLLHLRFAARLRDLAAARGRGPWVQSLVVAVGVMAALALLTLPWALYTGYFREHQYGMSNHTLGGFMREWLIGTALGVVFIGLAVSGIYRLLRRVRERWVLWATAVTFVLILFVFMVSPVFVAPLFNVARDIAAGRLEVVLEGARRAEIGIYALFSSRRQLPTRTKLLLDHLSAWFAPDDWRLRPPGHPDASERQSTR